MNARMLFVSLLFATSVAAQTFQHITVKEIDAASGVANAIARVPHAETAWAAWTVPTKGRSVYCQRCTLDGRHGGFSINDDDGMPFLSKLVVVARLENGKLRRIHFYNANCPIEGDGETVHLLTNATAESSVDYLRAGLRDADKESEIIAAISFHEHPTVVPLLIDLARHDASTKIRRDALFWLGQKAGEKAAAELRRAVDEDPNEDVKEHAVFAISQLPKERSVPILIDLVKNHKSRAVRKRAMFWLAQTNDPKALDLIEEILTR
jgi:HEAT repeat protein/PBS lyase HEAT-like repeat-containing protein